MALILIPSKLVDIPKNADLWKHFCYETLVSKIIPLHGFLQNTFFEEHIWRAGSGHLHYNKTHIYMSNYLRKKLMFKLVSLIFLTPKCQNYTFINAHISFYFYPSPHFLIIISTLIRRF